MEAVVKAIGEIEDTYIEIGTDLLEMANVLPEKTAKENAHDPKTVGASAARQKLYDAIANLTDEQCTKLLGVVEWAKENK